MWSIYDFQANNYRQVDFRMTFFLQTGFDMENCIISSQIDTYNDYDTRNVLGHYGVIIKRRQALDNVFFSCLWDQVFCVSHRLICEESQVMGVKWGKWALTLYLFIVNKSGLSKNNAQTIHPTDISIHLFLKNSKWYKRLLLYRNSQTEIDTPYLSIDRNLQRP